MKFCSLNYTDVQQIYQKNTRFPFVLGHEISGTISEVGEKCKGLKVGDRVVSLLGNHKIHFLSHISEQFIGIFRFRFA